MDNHRKIAIPQYNGIKHLLMLSLVMILGFSGNTQAAFQWKASDYDIYSGDFNGDSITDVILNARKKTVFIAGYVNTFAISQPPSWVLQANVDGSYQVIHPVSQGQLDNVLLNDSEHTIFEGDFDGDGNVDLLLQGQNATVASVVIYGQSIESVSPTLEYIQDLATVSVDSTTSTIVITDANNDGTDEIVLQQADGSNVTLYGTPSGISAEMPRVVGNLKGSFSVENDGSVSYSVPVSVPPGINSMQPGIGLSYNSGSGDGYLGIGWSLSGESSITRCPLTEEDGLMIDSVDFDDNDQFCLDGERLILITEPESHGKVGAKYNTSTSLVSVISIEAEAGNGPAYFKVESATGRTLMYGNSNDSHLQRTGGSEYFIWHLKTVTDIYGNEINYVYNNDKSAGEDYLESIVYGLNGQYEVKFEYEDRVGILSGYSAETFYSVNKRLKGVRTHVDGSEISRLNVNYENSTNRNKAVSIEKCSFNECLPVAGFNWSAGSAAAPFALVDSGISTTLGSNSGWSMSEHVRTVADVNGDGLSDIVAFGTTGTAVFLAIGEGKFQYVDSGITTMLGTDDGWGNAGFIRTVADVNGDGRTDIVAFGKTGTAVALASATTDGKFEFVDSGLSTMLGTDDGWGTPDYGRSLADVNGDGRADIVAFGQTGTAVALATGGGKFEFVESGLSTMLGANSGWGASGFLRTLADVNGDGMADIIAFGQTGTAVALAIGGGKFEFVGSGISTMLGADAGWNNSAFTRTLSDVNGDGMTDIIAFGQTGTAVALAIGGGKFEFVDSGISTMLGADDGWGTEKHVRTLADVDGDGMADIIAFGNTGTAVALAIGGGKFEFVDSGLSTMLGADDGWRVSDHVRSLGDVDGDGMVDIVAFGNSGTAVALNQNQQSLINVFADSFGNTTTVNYEYLTQTGAYAKGTDAAYPVADIQPPISAVTSVVTPNGIGGTNTVSYKYSGLKSQVRGLGSLGFRTIEQTNNITGVTSITTYDQNWQNQTAGMIERTETIAPNGVVLSQTVSDFDDRFDASLYPDATNTPTGMHKPYIKRTTTLKKDLDDSFINIVSSETELDNRGRPVNQYSCNTPMQLVPALTSTINCTGMVGWERKQHVQHEYYPEGYRAINPDLLKYKWITSEVPHTLPFQDSSETRVTFYDYNLDGKLSTEITEPEGVSTQNGIWLKTEFEYTTKGQLNKTIISGADFETRTGITIFDDQGRTIEGINAIGHSVKTYYEDTRFPWKATRTEDLNGLSTTTVYDSFGAAYKQIFANGNTTETLQEWCDAGNCDLAAGELFYSVTSSTGSADSITYYDKLSRAIRSTGIGFDGSDSGKLVTTETLYNAKGQVEKQYQPYYDGEFNNLYTYTEYDVLGRPEHVTDAAGRTSHVAYSGLTTTFTGTTGKTKTTRRNTLGKTVEAIDHASNSLTYAFDMWGALAEVIDSDDNTTQIGRNLRGFRTKLDDPDQGIWFYDYNTQGQMINQTDAKGQIIHSTFDLLGRRLTSTTAFGTANEETSTWAYDGGYKGLGKLTSLTNNGSVSENYYYNTPYGQPSEVTSTIDGQTYQSLTTYDAIGRVDEVTYAGEFVDANQYPSGFTVKNGYHTALGNLESIKGITGAEKTYWQAKKANANGQMIQSTLGLVINTERSFDSATGELIGVKALSFGSVIQELDYQWNDDGLLDYFWDRANSVEEAYGYDSYNRLNSIGATGNQAQSLTYDALGNITYKSDVGTYGYAAPEQECGTNTHAGPHAVTQITNGPKAGYRCYDANGNMINGDGRTVEYSATNKPTRITKGTAIVDFYYGPSNARYKKVETKPTNTGQVDSTTYYLGGGQFEKEIVGNTVKRKFYIGGNTLITMESTSTTQDITTSYLLKDHLGSTNTVVSFMGVVQERMSFDPWGNRRLTNLQPVAEPLTFSSTFTSRGFTGHEHIDSVGLIHMNGRVYDPVLARFVSPDPIVQAPKDLQSYNRYSYVINNPLGYTDPSGYSRWSKYRKKFTRAFKKVLHSTPEYNGYKNSTKFGFKMHMKVMNGNGYIRKQNEKLLSSKQAQQNVGYVMAVADWAFCKGFCSAAFSAHMVAISGGDWSDTANAYNKSLAISIVGTKIGNGVGEAGQAAGYAANTVTAMRVGAALAYAGTVSYASGGKFMDGVRSSFMSMMAFGALNGAKSLISMSPEVVGGEVTVDYSQIETADDLHLVRSHLASLIGDPVVNQVSLVTQVNALFFVTTGIEFTSSEIFRGVLERRIADSQKAVAMYGAAVFAAPLAGEAAIAARLAWPGLSNFQKLQAANTFRRALNRAAKEFGEAAEQTDILSGGLKAPSYGTTASPKNPYTYGAPR